MHIVERTLKIVLATLLAVFLAENLSLSYSASAGIIAILGILDTRQSSFQVALQRLLSFVLAMALASVCFTVLGFNLPAFGLYLLLFVPLSYRLQLQAGLAPITVLVTHLLAYSKLSLTIFANELALFALGTLAALLLNLYMPSKDKEIDRYHEQVEQQLKAILYRFENFLLKGSGRNDAQLIGELDAILEEALELVYRDRHNHLFHQTNYQVHYFEMRQQQNKLLQQMARNINLCHLESHENAILASLFHETARQLSEHNPGHDLMDEIEQALSYFRQRPLPQSREEFETRAVLFQLLQDLERFIQMKIDFFQSYPD